MRLSDDFVKSRFTNYDKVFIIEDMNLWQGSKVSLNKVTDLVLTLDFNLKHKLISDGYNCEYLDHIANREDLETQNLKLHWFLNNWYDDENGESLFNYKNYNLGNALLLNIINDATYISHFALNLIALKNLYFNQMFVAVSDDGLKRVLSEVGFIYEDLNSSIRNDEDVFSFPIISWIRSRTSQSKVFKFKNLFANILDNFFFLILKFKKPSKPSVYIQNYHPTIPIIDRIYSDSDIQVILPNYPGIRSLFKYRRIHVEHSFKSDDLIEELIINYQKTNIPMWVYEGLDLGALLKDFIVAILKEHLSRALDVAESLDRWMNLYNLKLMVSVTDFWVTNRLLMQYCFGKKIPVFTIINGLLNTSFPYEAKDSDYVNCYSDSVKKNYFNNKGSVYSLGDPRMDKYAFVSPKSINRCNPVVFIGTAGYDSTDLNSYVAYEFDFLFDILETLNGFFCLGRELSVTLKVRSNGYAHAYEKFVQKYFPDLNVTIIQNESFFEFIQKADLYISFYSQTIIEASCCGIPTIYYKKDTQFIHAPFDGRSELITANDVLELKFYVSSFFDSHLIFDEFMKKEVLEKYIGPLDGFCTERNLEFIKKIIN